MTKITFEFDTSAYERTHGKAGLRLLGLRLAGQPARAPTSGYADAKRWVKEHICEMAPADYAGHIHITVCT